MATGIGETGTSMGRITGPRSDLSRQEVETSAEFVSAGSMGEAIAGIGVVVLAIIGLAGLYPGWLTPIAVIVMGGALMLQGVAVALRFYALLAETTRNSTGETELGTGMGAEVLGGAAGIILGILALLDIYPFILLPVAVIVFGASLLLGMGANMRLNSLNLRRPWIAENDTTRRVMADVLSAANGTQALVGLAAIVLGIVALVNFEFPLTLTLVALIALGGSVLLSGGAIVGKMMGLMGNSCSFWGRQSHSVSSHTSP